MEKYHILINKQNKFEDNGQFEIAAIKTKYGVKKYLEKETKKKFFELKKQMARLGYVIDVGSGYRTSSYQEKIFNDNMNKYGIEHTNIFVALPGYSEHQSGLAVDVCLYENDKWHFDSDISNLDFLRLLSDISYKYGFIIRYPQNKSYITGYAYEPWHLRYVGSDLASKLYNNGKWITMEEYYLHKKRVS